MAVDGPRGAGPLVANQVGNQPLSDSGISHKRDEGVPELPGCPGALDSCRLDGLTEVAADVGRVSHGGGLGGEHVVLRSERAPGILGGDLGGGADSGQDRDDVARQRNGAAALRCLGVAAVADRAPHLDVWSQGLAVPLAARTSLACNGIQVGVLPLERARLLGPHPGEHRQRNVAVQPGSAAFDPPWTPRLLARHLSSCRLPEPQLKILAGN